MTEQQEIKQSTGMHSGGSSSFLQELGYALALIAVGAAFAVSVMVHMAHSRCERFDRNYLACEVRR